MNHTGTHQFLDKFLKRYPQLRTVENVAEQMGFEAAHIMIKILSEEELVSDKIVVNQELVLKGTTRKAG
ncbi:hypothetical protein [Reichenbachiella sp.]|uniref:hypothetical protein n=1 Tax=Reichenbachiella sp. TaxID=2184521 RepID=UPI003265D2FD